MVFSFGNCLGIRVLCRQQQHLRHFILTFNACFPSLSTRDTLFSFKNYRDVGKSYDDMFCPIISRVSDDSFKIETHTQGMNSSTSSSTSLLFWHKQLINSSIQTESLKLIKMTSWPLSIIPDINLTHLIAKIVFSLFLRK